MTIVYLIININMNKNIYLEKSLIYLIVSNKINYKSNINKNFIKSNFKIYNNQLYFIYNDEIYLDSDIHEYINYLQNYIKNIYPEYGKEWYFSYKKCDTDIIYKVNNLCNIL